MEMEIINKERSGISERVLFWRNVKVEIKVTIKMNKRITDPIMFNFTWVSSCL